MPYMKVHHEVDPKQKILDDLGDTSGLSVADNHVVVAVYQRPTTMSLGGKTFHVTDKTVSEDRYQSKVGLVVAHGPYAFKDPKGVVFNGVDFKIGDWVVIPPSAVTTLMVNGVLCRVVLDEVIKVGVTDPDMIY